MYFSFVEAQIISCVKERKKCNFDCKQKIVLNLNYRRSSFPFRSTVNATRVDPQALETRFTKSSKVVKNDFELLLKEPSKENAFWSDVPGVGRSWKVVDGCKVAITNIHVNR